MTAVEKLQAFLPDRHYAALILSDVNRRYLSGFSSSAGAVLVTKSRAVLLLDFRYYEAACKAVKPPIEVLRFKKLTDSLNEIFTAENITAVFVEGGSLTVSEYSRYTEALTPVLVHEGLSEKLSELRTVKTDTEIEKIIKAQRITEKAYLEVLNFLKPGVTERKIAIELEHLIKVCGGERVAFDLICITGENTSLPHGVPTDRQVKKGDFFTFDIGAVYDGYHSDMTRTVAVGYADEEMQKVYAAVLQAHKKAQSAIKAGAAAADVDLAARDYIELCGYGECFGHSTGHGVGLEIHEAPTVYKTCDTKLENGMVITDEPGIYLPGRFGVRIEDMFLVNGDKAADLAEISKELIAV